MRGKFWRLQALLAVVALFVLMGGMGARADEQPLDGGKAQDFKSRAFDVKENGKARVTLLFPAGKEAVVTVRGAKKTDVHLFVYDAAGKIVTKDDSPGPNCDVKLKPSAAGKYTFEISNVGPGSNSCTLKVELAK